MSKIILYSKKNCPYCFKAKELFFKKGLYFQEIYVDNNNCDYRKMVKLSGNTSVPQIFIDGFCIGGCDDLYLLNFNGKLDDLLK